jgi:DNA recombination protein RmuC
VPGLHDEKPGFAPGFFIGVAGKIDAMRLIEISLLVGLSALILVTVFLLLRIHALRREQTGLPALLTQDMEARHRAVLTDLHAGLAQQSDRMQGQLAALQIAQTERLAETRETVTSHLGQFQSAMLEKLIEQGRAEQSMLQDTLKGMTAQFNERVQQLSQTVDGRLNEISGKVAERLDEGFKKTNETFTSVMSRLAVIDEAQKKIEGLASNVVSLQEILGDKRSRGAFGEVQLEALVRNSLPPDAYAFQHTLKSGARVDCVLILPEPTGTVCVDSKFPLENYSRMFDDSLPAAERDAAKRQFKMDVKKHVDDIAAKYIVEGETSDGAVMFLPAEAVFAEIHAYHPDLVEHAQKKRVWLTSPTTLMAVLNTARAVIRDSETRRMAHVIKDELSKLAKDFARFDERMKKLASHIEQANKDVGEVRISSDKISRRFQQIERVELDHPDADAARLLDADE